MVERITIQDELLAARLRALPYRHELVFDRYDDLWTFFVFDLDLPGFPSVFGWYGGADAEAAIRAGLDEIDARKKSSQVVDPQREDSR